MTQQWSIETLNRLSKFQHDRITIMNEGRENWNVKKTKQKNKAVTEKLFDADNFRLSNVTF